MLFGLFEFYLVVVGVEFVFGGLLFRKCFKFSVRFSDVV